MMIILGIETSCDDTAIGVVEASGGVRRPRFRVRANIISSQVKVHRRFGGVVPSLAAREHAKNFAPTLRRALRDSGLRIQDVDLIAVTTHPGLLPSLFVGVHAARTLAWALRKPLLGINHLEGHLIANLLRAESSWRKVKSKRVNAIRSMPYTIRFPAIGLIVSGGHTQLVLLKDFLTMRIIGETRDDAAGEAFDKVAKLLGLPFPGGPPVAATAARYRKDSHAEKTFSLPRPMINSNDFDFSFSGLKTAVLYLLRDLSKKTLGVKQGRMQPRTKEGSLYPIPQSLYPALCAEFQQAVIDVLIAKTVRAAKRFRARTVLLGGGVAANRELRKQLREALSRELPSVASILPPLPYTLDNGAMIAAAAYLHWETMTASERRRAQWENVRVRAS